MEISLTVVNICQMIVEPGPWMSVFPYDLADFLRIVLTTFVSCNGKKTNGNSKWFQRLKLIRFNENLHYQELQQKL